MNIRKSSIIGLLGIVILGLIACGPAGPQVDRPTTGDELLIHSWRLVSYGIPGEERQVPQHITVTLTFEPGGRVSGSAGCNSYGGSYQLSGNELTFSPLESTLMACLDDGVMEIESDYLRALSTAESYQVSGDQLQIEYQGGTGVLTFVKQ
jgi:heat shock protein HslJ